MARKWQLRPDLIIGDLDSLPAEDQEFWAAQGCLSNCPSAQGSDGLGTGSGVRPGPSHFHLLVGAWGSRIDHALGNVEILYRLALQEWKTT